MPLLKSPLKCAYYRKLARNFSPQGRNFRFFATTIGASSRFSVHKCGFGAAELYAIGETVDAK